MIETDRGETNKTPLIEMDGGERNKTLSFDTDGGETTKPPSIETDGGETKKPCSFGPPKMAEMLPYGSLHHDGCWPLHGQKSCYKKCDLTEMGARTPRPILTNAVAERNGLIVCGRPY